MFRQKEWPFTGASGTEYLFSILPKSEGLPNSAGIFILAYTHPRGHAAGWEVNPLFIGHADDMNSALDAEAILDRDQIPLWNCNFVLLESDASARERCARDLKSRTSKED